MDSKLSVRFSDLVIKSLIKPEESGDKVFEVAAGDSGATYTLMEFSSNDSTNRFTVTPEAEIMKKLDHPNIVKCYELFDIEGVIYILLEHMDRGSLVSLESIKSESDLASVAIQILSGVGYLHGKAISHGDIKPSKFFVNSKNQVKVLYLGEVLSKTPRVVSGIEAIYDEFSWDIWNVGLSILKLYMGSTWRLRDLDTKETIKSKEIPGSPNNNFEETIQKSSKKLWSFLQCCMRTDLSKRWSAAQLISHPFVIHQYYSFDRMKGPVARMVAQTAADTMGQNRMEMTSDTLSCGEEDQTHLEKKKRHRSSSTSISTYLDVASESFQSFEVEHVNPQKKSRHDSSSLQISSSVNVASESTLSFGDVIDEVGSSKDLTQTEPNVQFWLHSTPDYLQRCLQYCSLFLPDSEFEKDKLVQLWIAEGCIEEEPTERMEDVANFNFATLVNEEIIIPSGYDTHYRLSEYRVNTSKFSSRCSKPGKYLRIDEGNLDEMCGEALHLTWHGKRLDQSLFEGLKNCKQLRTFRVHEDSGALIKQLPNDIFLFLESLRTLDLSHTHISELPGTIGKLKSLRCLDVSETPIKRLPESTDFLHFLQTLRLRGCFRLFALPRGLGKLTELRHLDLDIVGQLKSMPKGMGNLTKLQTLQAFLVGKNEGCTIRELKSMNEITGSFCISRLENVASAAEAKEVALADKQHIEKLELRWNDLENEDSPDTAEILEYLQPHFHLRELQITHFSGSKLPSWISNPSFTGLSSITLYKCINCQSLPPMGELPSLKILHIIEMNTMRDINTLFCRPHGMAGEFKAFPRLEKLILDSMMNLEEWTGIEDGDFPCLGDISIRYCPKLSVLPSMSHLCSLQHLEVSHCVLLVSLPEGLLPSSLESLIVRDCPRVNELRLKDGGLDQSKIAHVKNVWIDFQKISLD